MSRMHMGEQKETYRVPRTWENLPSLVLTPVASGFSWSRLVESIVRGAPDKELVCLVSLGRTSSRIDAERRNQLLYEFADDPKLVLMRFLAPIPGTEQVVLRAWFVRETMSQVTATNLFDVVGQLSQLAKQRGLRIVTVE